MSPILFSHRPRAGVSSVLAALAIALLFLSAGPVAATNCLVGKNKCVSKKVKALLKCHVNAEKHGTSLTSPEGAACLQRVRAKFDGAQLVPPDPSRGCFERLEGHEDPGDPATVCKTHDDSDALESKVDAFVDDVVQRLDPAYPAAVTNLCSAAKELCVLKKTIAILKCHERAARYGLAEVDTCVQTARDKFDGGVDAAHGCFARAEVKFGAACPTTNDTTALESAVDDFVSDALCELQYTTLPCFNPTPVPGPCQHQADGTCGGDCGSPMSHCFLMVGGVCGCFPPTPTATRTVTPTPPTPTPTVTSVRCDLASPPACAGGDCGTGGFSSCQFMFGGCVCEPPTPTPPQPTVTP